MKKMILLCLVFLFIAYVNILCLNNKVLIIGSEGPHLSTRLTKFYDKQIDFSEDIPLNIDDYDALFILKSDNIFYISNGDRLIQYLKSGKKLYSNCASILFHDKAPFWDYVGVSAIGIASAAYRADSIFGVPDTFAEEIKVQTSVFGNPTKKLFGDRVGLSGVLYPVLEAKDKMTGFGLKLAYAREIGSAKIVIHLQSDEKEIEPFLARVICNYFGLCDSVTVGVINQSAYLYPLKIHVLPNPFSNSTTIVYILSEPANVRINIYNALGSRIITLEEGVKEIGEHIALFEAGKLPPGMYYYTIQIGEQIESGKMVLVR